ncbi:serine/threonine protein kinase [Indivirus ILV1]|uniref:Serine/threonine protein kinase n=1 Tax=Indivirus ILV1 TaxID=1977633 RepID=A0A1V0SD90_9VIRU|nr:serine/threonine protein kinase [Indivirus ILV1]
MISKSEKKIINDSNCEILINSSLLIYNNLQINFLESQIGKKYDIVKPIYEKDNEGIYIINELNTRIKYILKIKKSQNLNCFGERIYKILSKNQHKNILTFVSFIRENEYTYSIYEYVNGYNLSEYIKIYGDLLEKDIKYIFNQLVDALIFLHSYNILHCDLKLENIIINHKKEIKVIDFDLSIICYNDEGYISNNIFGTLQYIAPESYDLCIYSKKTDIWQLGVILYIIITGKFPHNNEISYVNSYSNLCRKNIFKHIDLNYPRETIIKKKFNLLLYNLLENMLCFDEKKRYSLDIISKKLINQ